ncbi:hypothetical protein B0A48_08414 [Cryoendolithus antarcticus]|uniref:C2H2-type domain-containing protein n=1 Tax=Cryoendolithus antarcticus TaxID=1507870 RepID=A0A1V8T5D8_9PEZI|nr:hypothetical protein B0A48_08414 [Cryoendolithus antarcticus]
MASGSAPHREAGMPATHLDFRGAEAIPDEAFAFLLGLARLQIEPPDLTRWYTRLYDNVRVDNVPDPESGPQAEDATAQHQIKHTHEQYLHDTEIPETAAMPVPVATQHVTGAPAFFCPFPGCRRLKTYVNRKACKRHAESHWVRYTCPGPGCSRIWSRLDHFRKHERTDEGHGCRNLQCTHADDAVNVVDPWQALGCGFCWKVFAIQSQPAGPLHLRMHAAFGEYTKHVFQHMSDGATRAEWSRSFVIWSLLHGPNTMRDWTALYTRQFNCDDLYSGPILAWEDRAATSFVSRLQNGETGAVLYELLLESIRPPDVRFDATTNADPNAGPYSVTVSNGGASLPTGQETISTELHVYNTAAAPSAYPEVSSSWRSDAGNYGASNPLPGVGSTSGRVSDIFDHEAFRNSGESGPDQHWPNASPTEEDVAHAGTHFVQSNSTALDHDDNLPTIHYDAGYEHDRVDLHGVEPGTDSLEDDLVPPIAGGTSFSRGRVDEPSGTFFVRTQAGISRTPTSIVKTGRDMQRAIGSSISVPNQDADESSNGLIIIATII